MTVPCAAQCTHCAVRRAAHCAWCALDFSKIHKKRRPTTRLLRLKPQTFGLCGIFWCYVLSVMYCVMY